MKENQNFPKRLAGLRSRQGMTQADLAHKLGVSVGSVGNWESSPNPPHPKNLRKIADFFEVSIGWLLGDQEEMVPSNARSPSNLLLVDRQTNVRSGLRESQEAPLISWASAGNANAFIDQGYNVERIPTKCRDPHCYCLEVEGDSMEPKYSKGDIIFVAPSTLPRNGDLVVAKTKREDVYFKLYHWTNQEKDKVKLTSFNPAYPVIEAPRSSLIFVQPVHSSLRLLRKDL